MADFASIISQSALKNTQPGKLDIAGNMAKGAQLAVQKQKLQQQKAQLQQKKLETEIAKESKIMDTIKLANNTDDPQLSKMLLTKVLPAKVKALGQGGIWSQDVMEGIQKSEAMRGKLMGLDMLLQDKVAKGEITMQEAYKRRREATGDAEFLTSLDTDSWFEASKFQVSEQGKDRRSRMQAEAQAARFSAREESQDFRAFDRRVAEFRKSVERRLKPQRNAVDQLSLAKKQVDQIYNKWESGKELTSEDLSTLSRIGTTLARGVLSEKGQMSDRDRKYTMEEAGLVGQLRELKEFLLSKPNPKKVASFKKLVDTATEVQRNRFTENAQELNQQLNQTPMFQGRVDQARTATGLTGALQGLDFSIELDGGNQQSQQQGNGQQSQQRQTQPQGQSQQPAQPQGQGQSQQSTEEVSSSVTPPTDPTESTPKTLTDSRGKQVALPSLDDPNTKALYKKTIQNSGNRLQQIQTLADRYEIGVDQLMETLGMEIK